MFQSSWNDLNISRHECIAYMDYTCLRRQKLLAMNMWYSLYSCLISRLKRLITSFSAWNLGLKISQGTGDSPHGIWFGTGSQTSDDTCALQPRTPCLKTYKSNVVDEWQNVSRVMFGPTPESIIIFYLCLSEREARLIDTHTQIQYPYWSYILITIWTMSCLNNGIHLKQWVHILIHVLTSRTVWLHCRWIYGTLHTKL